MNPDVHCSLPRRLAIILYDGIVVIAVAFFATLPVVLIRGGAVEGSPVFTLYLLAVIFLFFGWFWTHGGQTIGMRAWRVRVIRDDGDSLRWSNAAVRYAAAILSWVALGAGFWWSLLDRDGLTWHDRLSATRLQRIAKH